MKRKITKALALLLVLCMLIPTSAMAAGTTYKLNVSITDGGSNTVSDASGYVADTASLVATIATVIDINDLKVFGSPAMREKLVNGIAAAHTNNQSTWNTFIQSMTGASGNLLTHISNISTPVTALTVGNEYTITYENTVTGDAKVGTTYTITVKMEERSSGGTGGGASGGGGGTAAPVDPDPMAGAPGSQIFIDVPADHAFCNEIEWAYNEGLLKGVTENAYEPGDSISRQQLWMTLGRLAGVDPADMAAAKAWAVELGISDGTIPGAAVTRQQMVTIIYRFAQMKGYDTSAKADLSAFPDADKLSDYAADAMEWAVANGIVNGTLAGTLNPAGNTTRGQFAAILYRFANKFV